MKKKEQGKVYVKSRTYRDLPSASAEENDVYFDKAREFLHTTGLYGSELGTAVCAIADYLAHLDGKQLLRT